MKLTLSISGGFTGLTKEHTVDVEGLDKKTLDALKQYFLHHHRQHAGPGVTENWMLNDDKQVQVHMDDLPQELKALYLEMKKNLRYKKQ